MNPRATVELRTIGTERVVALAMVMSIEDAAKLMCLCGNINCHDIPASSPIFDKMYDVPAIHTEYEAMEFIREGEVTVRRRT